MGASFAGLVERLAHRIAVANVRAALRSVGKRLTPSWRVAVGEGERAARHLTRIAAVGVRVRLG